MSRANERFAGCYMDKNELRKLDEIAEWQDRSRSALLRKLIREEIKRVGKSVRRNVGQGFKKELKDDLGTG